VASPVCRSSRAGASSSSRSTSPRKLTQAKAHVALADDDFRLVDLHELADEKFDHVFICFVLEHLADPVSALAKLRSLLKPGGTITVIEGDHGSAVFHPQSPRAQAVIDCLIDLPAAAGDDSLIGRRLQPLLEQAGYDGVRVEPRTLYADQNLTHLVDGFTRKTFIAMVGSVRERALAAADDGRRTGRGHP
jgi:SAM-dependent methyltransferase